MIGSIEDRLAAVIVAATIVLAGCNRGPQQPDRGTVVVYTSVDEVFAEPICRAFERKTGITVALVPDTEETKSTGLLNRLIAGLERAGRGEVWIDGALASTEGRILVPPQRRGIAMLFQDLALWPNLTVEGNVRLGLSGGRLARREVGRRTARALDACGITELADRCPATLSGGQQQRVALARALAVRPKLLLLDEPLGGLDLITKQAVLEQIARLKAEFGFAVILVTHDPIEVRGFCDSLAVLEDHRIAEHGPLREILADPRSQLGKAFARAAR